MLSRTGLNTAGPKYRGESFLTAGISEETHNNELGTSLRPQAYHPLFVWWAVRL